MTLNLYSESNYDINPVFDKTPWLTRANDATFIAFVHTPQQVQDIIKNFNSNTLDTSKGGILSKTNSNFPAGLGRLFHPPYLHNFYGRKELLYGYKTPRILLLFDSSTLHHLILIQYSQRIDPVTSLSTPVNILRPWLKKLPPSGPFPHSYLSIQATDSTISSQTNHKQNTGLSQNSPIRGSIKLTKSSQQKRGKRFRSGDSPPKSIKASANTHQTPSMTPEESRNSFSWTTDPELFLHWVSLNRQHEKTQEFEPPGVLIHSYLCGDSPFTVEYPRKRSKTELKALIPSISVPSAAKQSLYSNEYDSNDSNNSINQDSCDQFLASCGNFDALFSRVVRTSSLPPSSSGSKSGEMSDVTFHIYRASFKNSSVMSYHQRIRIFSILAIEIGEYIHFDDEKYNDWEILFCFAKFPAPPEQITSKNIIYGYSLVSYVTYFAYRGYPNNVLRISQMVCLPPFQKQGHGAQLLISLYRDSVARGYDWVTVYDASEQFRLLRDVSDYRLLLSKGYFNSGIGPVDSILSCLPRSQEELEKISRETGIMPLQVLRVYEILLLAHVLSSIIQDPTDTDPIIHEVLQSHPLYLNYVQIVRKRIYANFLQGISDTSTVERTLNDLWDLHLSDYEDILDKLHLSNQLPNYSDPRWLSSTSSTKVHIQPHPFLLVNHAEKPSRPNKPRHRLTSQEKWWEYGGETTSDEDEDDDDQDEFYKKFSKQNKNQKKLNTKKPIQKSENLHTKTQTIQELMNVRDYHFETFSPSSEDEEPDEASKMLKFWKVKFVDRTDL